LLSKTTALEKNLIYVTKAVFLVGAGRAFPFGYTHARSSRRGQIGDRGRHHNRTQARNMLVLDPAGHAAGLDQAQLQPVLGFTEADEHGCSGTFLNVFAVCGKTCHYGFAVLPRVMMGAPLMQSPNMAGTTKNYDALAPIAQLDLANGGKVTGRTIQGFNLRLGMRPRQQV
jgi:hypothetical protein